VSTFRPVLYGLIALAGLLPVIGGRSIALQTDHGGVEAPSDRYILTLDLPADAAKDTVDSSLTTLKTKYHFEPALTYYYAMKGAAVSIPGSVATALADEPAVLFVERDSIMSAAAQTTPNGVRRIGGRLNGPARIDSINDAHLANYDVAILDTGIDVDHPELQVAGGVRYSDLDEPDCNNGSSSFDDDHGYCSSG
jgi:hypothetical protein